MIRRTRRKINAQQLFHPNANDPGAVRTQRSPSRQHRAPRSQMVCAGLPRDPATNPRRVETAGLLA
jgi:hypothetical protein